MLAALLMGSVLMLIGLYFVAPEYFVKLLTFNLP